jgi:hypothetical protein
MNTKQITITPAIASNILAVNNKNRRVRSTNVQYWSTCIERGTAELTPQGISIEGTLKNPKRLLDGQHRLLAVIATGKPLESLLFENCNPSIFKYIDCGARRTLGDLTGMDIHTVQMVKLLARIYIRRRILSSDDAEQIGEILGDHGIGGGARRGISSVAVKLAFALHKARTGEHNYEDWLSSKFDKMSKAQHKLYVALQDPSATQIREEDKLLVLLKTTKALENPNSNPIVRRAGIYTRSADLVERSSPELHEYLSAI